MLGWFTHLQKKWNDWCGDHEMELAIRRQLTEDGFYGRTAKLRKVRLVAVERPGWLQVFRFEATARVCQDDGFECDGPDPEADYQEIYGLVRDDIRHKINDVRVFEDEAERSELFAQWSENLICLRGAQGLTVR